MLYLHHFCFSFHCVCVAGRVRHCGLCVSGQSIRDAAERIKRAKHLPSNSLIINLGTYEILNGTTLLDMCMSYDHLIEVCQKRDLRPVITTIAPIANHCYTSTIPLKVIKFNDFLRKQYMYKYKVIDIYSQMVTPRGRTLYDYYQRYDFLFFIFLISLQCVTCFLFLFAVLHDMWLVAFSPMFYGIEWDVNWC